MFLQRLVEHGATRSDLPPAFYRSKQVHWLVRISTDGSTGRLVDLRPGKGERGQVTEAPYAYRSGVRPPAYLLVDSAHYVLAVPKPDPQDEAAREKTQAEAQRRHEDFCGLVARWTEGAAERPQALAAARFLTAGGLQALAPPEDIKHSDTVAIMVDDQYLHLLDSAKALWARIVRERKSGGAGRGLCLVCGAVGDLLDTIPESVKSGSIPTTGMSKDAQLVSVNTAAQGRAGTASGLASTPVCDQCGGVAMATLNALLGDQVHRWRGRSSVMVWWTKRPVEAAVFRSLDEPDPADVRRLLGSVQGSTSGAIGAPLDVNEFYAATLGLNNARVVLRDWIDVPLQLVEKNIATWFAQHGVYDGWQDSVRYLPLWQLTAATGRWDEKTSRYTANSALHNVEVDLLRAALLGAATPSRLLPHLLQRIRADHHLDRARVSLIQLVLARKPTTRKDTAMPGLDRDATDPGYLCGRMFAIFEATQHAALKNVNATVTDKYLGTAMTAPRSVLTMLRRGAQAHLKRLRRDNPGAAVSLERRLQEVSSGLTTIPATLDLEAQARFVLGYDHQRAADFADAREAKQKKTDSGDPAGEIAA